MRAQRQFPFESGRYDTYAPDSMSNNGTDPAPDGWPVPIGEAGYHGVVGDIVEEVAPKTEADPNAILVTLLVYFGNACGRVPGFYGDGKRHHLNENVAIVGESGARGRKGPATRVRVSP